MKKKLLNNWTLKLASLVLAFILWFLVVQIDDPKDSHTYSNIPVKLTNTDLLDKENKVYEVLDDTDVVSVKVRAPRSVLSQLRASDIVAVADMSKLTDINTIAISYTISNVDGVESIEGNHDAVRLNVEDKSTKWIKVVYDTVGEVADGYMLSNVTSDQTLVEVSGPQSAVDEVSYAGAEIEVTGANSNLSANPDLVLYDRDGNPLAKGNLKMNVDYVHMSVEVLAVKEVPVEVNYMGVPADGYMATGSVLCEPSTVRIAGTVYALSGVSKISIPEDRLNITGQDSDMTDIINLKEYLPDNIRLADGDSSGKVNVTIYIEPIMEKTLEIPAANLSVANVPDGLEAALPEELTEVTLDVSGFEDEISPLRQTAVTGIIDVKAWMEENDITELNAGTYTLPVEFQLADAITASDVNVRVTFTETP